MVDVDRQLRHETYHYGTRLYPLKTNAWFDGSEYS